MYNKNEAGSSGSNFSIFLLLDVVTGDGCQFFFFFNCVFVVRFRVIRSNRKQIGREI